VVLRLVHGHRSFLFAADIEAAAEAHIANDLAPADVLKVAHHGSKSSSSPAFLAAVDPKVAVISCGEGNVYGHPHPATLDALAGRNLMRTDLDGTVEVSTDGRDLRLRSWNVGRGWEKWPRVGLGDKAVALELAPPTVIDSPPVQGYNTM